jgi:hypothetical protein
VTSAEESILSETRNQRIVAKLLEKRFWVKKSLLILTILLYNSVDLPLGARRKRKKQEGNSFRNFVFRVRVSEILVVIIRLFVAASSCVLWILPAIFPLQKKPKNPTSKETELRRRRSYCCV